MSEKRLKGCFEWGPQASKENPNPGRAFLYPAWGSGKCDTCGCEFRNGQRAMAVFPHESRGAMEISETRIVICDDCLRAMQALRDAAGPAPVLVGGTSFQ